MRAIVQGRFKPRQFTPVPKKVKVPVAPLLRSRSSEFAPVGVVVHAPVRYEAGDFIAYLFASICLAVLRGRDPDEPSGWRPWRRAGLLCAGGLLVFVAGNIIADPYHWGLAERSVIGVPLILVGFALAVAGVGYLVALLLQIGLTTQVTARRARRHLHELRNLDTFSQAFSGAAGPSLLGIRSSRTVSSARQAPTVPELVRHYQQFVAFLTKRQPVVIGIDELDKIESDREARRFLNDVKGLFGQPDCYYLVSVSEDALSAFERRGMPFRDVFDSTFDTVLRVEPMSAGECATLLRRRVVGFGAAAHLLCYVLSGGLPRELIRAARHVVELAGNDHVELAELLWPLAHERMRAAEQAAVTVAQRSVLPDGTHPLLRWIHGLPDVSGGNETTWRERWNVHLVLGELDACAMTEPACDEARMAALQLAVLAYHMHATVDLFFQLSEQQLESLDKLLLWPAEAAIAPTEGSDLGSFDALAQARREMMLAPELAWRTISAQRGKDAEEYPGSRTRSDRDQARPRLKRAQT